MKSMTIALALTCLGVGACGLELAGEKSKDKNQSDGPSPGSPSPSSPTSPSPNSPSPSPQVMIQTVIDCPIDRHFCETSYNYTAYTPKCPDGAPCDGPGGEPYTDERRLVSALQCERTDAESDLQKRLDGASAQYASDGAFKEIAEKRVCHSLNELTQKLSESAARLKQATETEDCESSCSGGSGAPNDLVSIPRHCPLDTSFVTYFPLCTSNQVTFNNEIVAIRKTIEGVLTYRTDDGCAAFPARRAQQKPGTKRCELVDK